MKVLVTGGAGYIGSHIVRQLGEAGHTVIVYDNLSTGHAWAVLHGTLLRGDLADRDKVRRLVEGGGFDAVIHMAANIVVPESVADPMKYYMNNTRNTLDLLQICAEAGVPRVIFSSTAAVYGIPDRSPIPESAHLVPINPYGASKMMSERMLMDLAAAGGPDYVSLRYFNVAGADPQARIGQATPGATHLIKVACEAAAGLRDGLTVFGSDYPTPDGTCIRDYIHVEDLAAAHLAALDHLEGGGGNAVLNCGYGHGYSVSEVVETVRRVTGRDLRIDSGPRRAGDPPELVADNTLIRRTLDWTPRHDDLATIVETAWRWEQALAARGARPRPVPVQMNA